MNITPEEAHKKYRQELAKKGQEALKERAARGLYRGPVPLGFRRVLDQDCKRTLGPDPEIWPMVKHLFALSKNGYSVRETARILADLGYKTKRGLPISSSMVHYVLQNTIYLDFIF